MFSNPIWPGEKNGTFLKDLGGGEEAEGSREKGERAGEGVKGSLSSLGYSSSCRTWEGVSIMFLCFVLLILTLTMMKTDNDE